MDLTSIYVSNGAGIILVLVLRYASRTKTLRHRTEDKIYTFMAIGVLLGCFFEALTYTVDGMTFPGARFLNYFGCTYLYTFNLLLPFSVLAYVDIGLYGDTSRIWKKYKPQIFIGLFFMVVNVVNLFVPLTFKISETNVYERLPLANAYYVVILFYCLSALVVTKRYEKENGSRTFFRISVFLVPILLGAALQFMFYGLSLAWLAAAIGLTGLFMMQQNELAYIDALVDTYNRQYLSQVLTSWVNRQNSFVGVMLDADNFKAINDKYGHTEGDNALVTLANLLKQARSSNELVFRFAGDEFIVLQIGDTTDAMEAYMGRVNELLEKNNSNPGKPYILEVSYGISLFESGTVDDFMKAMDDKMYEMKALHHSREGNDRRKHPKST